MRHPVDYAPSQDFGDNPTAGLPGNHWIIQQFGNYQPDGHTGIDYPCPVGTPVRAAADGVVRHVGWMGGGYSDNPWWIMPSFAGYVYVVDHGHFIGIYGHCQDGGARVKVGQRVIEGQVLGLSGNTGASTGPHLHFEVLPDRYILNSHMYGRINPHSLFGGLASQGGTVTPIKTKPKEWDEMASKNDFKDAIREVIQEPAILDKIAMAILKRPCHLIDPKSGKVKGTTTLATKINWMAHNDQQILDAVVAVSQKIDVTHPVLPVDAPAAAEGEADV